MPLLRYALLILAATRALAAPPAPNYADPAAWAAFPGHPSAAQTRPPGAGTDVRDDVAVFFIHPTTYFAPRIDNAPFDAPGPQGRVDGAVLTYQASVFNFTSRLYAPRYRQASLLAITHHEPAAYAADDLAYADIARAFDAFLAAEPTRPFILASHSQGSIHALRLLQSRIAGTAVAARLVAAYLPGVALPLDIEHEGVRLCRTASDLGCTQSWNSVRAGYVDHRRLEEAVIWRGGHYEPIAGHPLACFNPLAATLGGAAPASANLGAVYARGQDGRLPVEVAGQISASCEQGLLGVVMAPALRRQFLDLLGLNGIYHDADYGLFYENVRRDAERRTQAWLHGAH